MSNPDARTSAVDSGQRRTWVRGLGRPAAAVLAASIPLVAASEAAAAPPDIDDRPTIESVPASPIESAPGEPLLTIPVGPVPIVPDDLVAEPAPECTEYAAAHFATAVERYDADLLEIRLSYDDADVCDFTVWYSIRAAADATTPLVGSSVGLATVAASTLSTIDAYHQVTIGDQDLCDWEIWIAVEEGLPEVHDAPDTCDEPAVPAVDGPGSGGTPSGAADESTDADRAVAPPLGEGSPRTPPGASTGGPLAQTQTDMTRLMLGGGLVALATGALAALMTRRRPDDFVV